MSPFSLPRALTRADPESIDAALAHANRMERHIHTLRLQGALLSLSLILEEHPQIKALRVRRLLDEDSEEEIFTVQTNRGDSAHLKHTPNSISNLFDSHALMGFAPIALDPGEQTPRDREALEALDRFVGSLNRNSLLALARATLRLPDSPSESLAEALMESALSPAQFAHWQAACLSAEPRPNAPADSPPAPRL